MSYEEHSLTFQEDSRLDLLRLHMERVVTKVLLCLWGNERLDCFFPPSNPIGLYIDATGAYNPLKFVTNMIESAIFIKYCPISWPNITGKSLNGVIPC